MKSYLLLLFVLFMEEPIHEKCIGNALLIPMHTYIPMYKDNDRVVTDSIINDTIAENYAVICIKEIISDLAKVKVNYTMDTAITKIGWIESKYLGIHLSNYSSMIKVMKAPCSTSKVSFYVKEPQWADFYTIIKAHNDWLYVQSPYSPAQYGWIAPEDQCNNPYTSCN